MHLLYMNEEGHMALKQVLDSKAEKYAILSHRWREDEVSFQDMKQPGFEQKAGYWKMDKCMQQALADGYKYCWVDTCCINKESSAELQEAINSMWTWYEDSQVCYAYLDDVALPGEVTEDQSNGGLQPRQAVISTPQSYYSNLHDFSIEDQQPGYDDQAFQKFTSSEWLQRGWTLQELLAQRIMLFWDSQWRCIGTREQLRGALHIATRIDRLTLYSLDLKVSSARSKSVATRMSWARGRSTTRVEDTAYCLMGLLDVNMPLLYGEGAKAFRRLQEELMRNSADTSILC